MEFLSRLAARDEDTVAILADDGEKFGVWPGTKEHVYDEGWLEDFFRLLTKNEDWIHTTTFKEYLENHPPKGRIYLPAASYREMKKWAGGFWRNFLVRYSESNRMHKKMLAVRKRLETVPRGEAYQRAQNLIVPMQLCLLAWCVRWSIPELLRAAIYENLIKAENIIVRKTMRMTIGWK